LAHGEAARAKLLAQFELRRQQIAHRIAPALDLVDERLRELAITRLRCEQIHKVWPPTPPPSPRAAPRSCARRSPAPPARRPCLRPTAAPPASAAPLRHRDGPARRRRGCCRARDAQNRPRAAARRRTDYRAPAPRHRPAPPALCRPDARAIP